MIFAVLLAKHHEKCQIRSSFQIIVPPKIQTIISTSQPVFTLTDNYEPIGSLAYAVARLKLSWAGTEQDHGG